MVEDTPKGDVMNKQEMIHALTARIPNTTLAQNEKFLNAFMDIVVTRLKQGHEVKLVGFGTFLRKRHKARVGVNPQTGQVLKIPARWLVKFRKSETWSV